MCMCNSNINDNVILMCININNVMWILLMTIININMCVILIM